MVTVTGAPAGELTGSLAVQTAYAAIAVGALLPGRGSRAASGGGGPGYRWQCAR